MHSNSSPNLLAFFQGLGFWVKKDRVRVGLEKGYPFLPSRPSDSSPQVSLGLSPTFPHHLCPYLYPQDTRSHDH